MLPRGCFTRLKDIDILPTGAFEGTLGLDTPCVGWHGGAQKLLLQEASF